MTPSQLRPPHPKTLKFYGITAETWYTYLDLQDGRCPICQREFTNELRPVIDHEHVKGFKKMKADKKQRFVRGLPCRYCNHRRLPKGSANLTPVEIAYNIYTYLSEYSMRNDDI
jgi:hypothetical protein